MPAPDVAVGGGVDAAVANLVELVEKKVVEKDLLENNLEERLGEESIAALEQNPEHKQRAEKNPPTCWAPTPS